MNGYKAATEHAGVWRLPHNVLVLYGSDSRDFLDRSVSNEVPRGNESRTALLLTPEGKTKALLHILNNGEAIRVLADTDHDIKETWESNIFVEDVEVEKDERIVYALQGPRADDILSSLPSINREELPSTEDELASFDTHGGVDVVWRKHSPEAGYYVVAHDTLLDSFLDAGAERVDKEAAQALRVEAGVPSFSNELKDRLPLVAGLRDALSFDKCYTGQEVVARVEQRGGGVEKHLACLDFEGVVQSGVSTEDVEVTSVAESPRLGLIGLGYVGNDTPMELDVKGVKTKVREPTV